MRYRRGRRSFRRGRSSRRTFRRGRAGRAIRIGHRF